MSVVIRHLRADERNFLVKSWVDSYRDSAVAHSLADGLYTERWSELAMHLAHIALSDVPLSETTALEALVLADESAPDVVVAWLLHEKQTLHYVFVREDFRRLGYARKLLQHASETFSGGLTRYTSRTTTWQVLTNNRRKPGDRLAFVPRMTYDPPLLWQHFGALK